MHILYRVWCYSLSLILIVCCWLDTPVLAVNKSPTSDFFNRGLNHLEQQNYQQALEDFTQVINRQDHLVGAAYSNRCLVNLQLQNYAAAEADCSQAINNNSRNIEAYLNLGLAYYYQGKYSEAIALDQQIIQLDRQDYRSYYNQGLAYFALNNYQSAIAAYQSALLFTSESDLDGQSLIYNELALSQVMLAQESQAELNLNLAIALNENNYHAYFNRGCIYYRQGQYVAAIEDFSQAIRLQPNLAQAYVNRAISQDQTGQKNAAVQDLNIALEQYQQQGDRDSINLVVNLKQKLFYPQANQIV